MAFTYEDDMQVLEYTSGSVAFTAGETVTGDVSGATGVVVASTIDSGAIVDGDAAGYLFITSKTLTFQAENLDGSVGGANMATIADDSYYGFSNLNYLRMLVGDTDSAFPLFTDNELNGWITKYTSGSTIQFLKAASICLKAISVDPDRLSVLADKLGGAMKLETLMDLCWKRAEALGG